MDKKTIGSWLVHHTGKLQQVVEQGEYENTFLSGKAGILLSAITADEQTSIESERLKALARASGVNTRTELPVILELLEERGLVDAGSSGIDVLGVTSEATLQHTADMFEALEPSSRERAALDLSELASSRPTDQATALEAVSDSYSLSSTDGEQLLSDARTIGFVDVEEIDNQIRLLFNGNLFRREIVQKVATVLDTLSAKEASLLRELDAKLSGSACLSLHTVESLLGARLWSKVSSIGLFDVSVVSNAHEEIAYVTKPAAFSKFNNAMVDDAFDLAKMFVASLTYGMTRSSYERGQITMIERLLGALIDGREIGPVSAIGEDYKILEMKGVVQVFHGQRQGRAGYMMKLLKSEVGVLALDVIRHADASEHSLSVLPTAAINRFRGPERNREIKRRKELIRSPRASNDILLALRTGGSL